MESTVHRQVAEGDSSAAYEAFRASVVLACVRPDGEGGHYVCDFDGEGWASLDRVRLQLIACARDRGLQRSDAAIFANRLLQKHLDAGMGGDCAHIPLTSGGAAAAVVLVKEEVARKLDADRILKKVFSEVGDAFRDGVRPPSGQLEGSPC